MIEQHSINVLVNVMSSQQQSQSGRNQLKDLLNDLVLQTTEENRELSPFEVDEDVEEAARELLEYSSPRKIHPVPPIKHRKNRKRSQKTSATTSEGGFIDEDSCTSMNEPVMIYGRHLNLTRLVSDSSLYSVGREWVRNDPYGQHTNEYPATTEPDSELDLCSSGLPCTDTNHRTNSDTYCPSLPPKLDANEMDKSLRSGVPNQQFHLLKQEHLKCWKSSRDRHREAYYKRQAKYSGMIQALQEMYH